MANDRVFIKCKFCEGWKMLFKYFPQTGAKTRDNGVLEWLDAHADCRPHEYEGDLRGDPGFTLHTENDMALDINKMGYIPKPGEAKVYTDDKMIQIIRDYGWPRLDLIGKKYHCIFDHEKQQYDTSKPHTHYVHNAYEIDRKGFIYEGICYENLLYGWVFGCNIKDFSCRNENI